MAGRKKAEDAPGAESRSRDVRAADSDIYGFVDSYGKRMAVLSDSGGGSLRRAWLTFLDMLCLLCVYQSSERPMEAVDRVGCLFSDVDLVRALEPSDSAPFMHRDRIRGMYDALFEKSAGFTDSGFYPLFHTGILSHLEILAFLMAFSSSVNRKYERIYGVLQEEKEGIVRPTMGLCLDLARFYLGEEEKNISLLLNPDSFLNRFILEKRENKRLDSELSTPLAIKSIALGYCLGERGIMGEIGLCGQLIEPVTDGYVCRPEQAAELVDVYSAAAQGEGSTLVQLLGEDGSGRRYLMGLLSAATGQPVVALDMRRLLSLDGPRQERILSDIILKAALEDALPYIYGIEEREMGGFEGTFALARLMESLRIIFIGCEKALSNRLTATFTGSVYRIELTETDALSQESLWKEAADRHSAVFDSDLSLRELVSKYTMSPGRIYEAVKNTVLVSSVSDGFFVIEKEELQEQIRRICSVQLGERAKRIRTSFTWDDLKVDVRSSELLRRACERVIFKSRVNEEFGFGKKLPYGRGVSIVLYGPPGTGKTMAAQVMARELGLDIYRIDLSQISSKYIGETEKNLAAVFDGAKNSNAILFFDEADSLFSKRTEVSSSNDRHANAETSYLLQKVEEYTGVSILATNNLQNFDAAFKRRITFLIPVEVPDEATRLMLWSSVFPKGAPLSGNIDFALLAGAIELTGSNIKSAAVDAAYRAAAADREITYQDIADAVDTECLKNGRMGAGNELLQAIISSGAVMG